MAITGSRYNVLVKILILQGKYTKGYTAHSNRLDWGIWATRYNRDTRLGVSRYLFGGRGEGRSRVSRYLVRVRPGCHAPAPCNPPLDPFSAAKVVRNRPFILSTKRAGLDFAAFIASALCAPWTIANPR